MISYILPTRNRCALLVRAIDSCLAAGSSVAPTEVIVIDGGSTDGTPGELENRYGGNRRVRTLQQDSRFPGFMNACFQGVAAVDNPFVTFMYDDDVLSPYIGQMYLPLISGESDFVLGLGAVAPSDRVFSFEPAAVPQRYDSRLVLEQYFGGSSLPCGALPASPICCLTTREHLIDWQQEVLAFAAKTQLRRYLMLERNIGPDQMIYLSGLLRSSGDVSVCLSTVAQFSTHSDSMSMTYQMLDLSIGYWLGRIFVIDKLVARRDFALAARCGGHLIARGVILAARATVSRKGAYLFAILKEMAGLVRSLAAIGQLGRAFGYCVRAATRRVLVGRVLTAPK
jgi:glycosyltransferase involved in cell wall biosynthesis